MIEDAERIAEQQRRIQDEAERRRDKGQKQKNGEPAQTGARPYPAPPLPQQHQPKPGVEAELEPSPMYDAPFYEGSGKLRDMAAIVTGGDSGIGRSVAVLFAREGADVTVVYLNEHDDAEQTKAAVEAEGRRCILIPGDVGDSSFCRQVVRQTVNAFGRLDILVNNAAFQQHVSDFTQLAPEQLEMTVRTNLYGYVYMAQAAVEHMKTGASIVNSGSVTGLEGSKELIDYAMTKGGIHALTRSLAAHLIERGIRVNAVAPGPVWTPLNPADQDSEKVAKFGSQSKMKRPAQPEEIAPAYVFLASPQTASYITGEILPIIGGY